MVLKKMLQRVRSSKRSEENGMPAPTKKRKNRMPVSPEKRKRSDVK
jgi:hypothetical protein